MIPLTIDLILMLLVGFSNVAFVSLVISVTAINWANVSLLMLMLSIY